MVRLDRSEWERQSLPLVHAILHATLALCVQGLLAELQKDERNVEGVITADLKKAENFLENIESQVSPPSLGAPPVFCGSSCLCPRPSTAPLWASRPHARPAEKTRLTPDLCSQYKLPKWYPFRDFVFRFPWDRATAAQITVPGGQ